MPEHLKCPKCGCYDQELKCDNCNYEGKKEEFIAKQYKATFEVVLYVLAFDDIDADKEIKDSMEMFHLSDLDPILIKKNQEIE